MVQRFLTVVFFVAIVFPSRPVARVEAATPLDWPIPNGYHFTEANGFPLGTSPMGFELVDDDQAQFWTAFQKLGGVNRLGYPASRRFLWEGFVSQVTQKAVLQWRPDTRSAVFVNVFDELSKLGKDDWLGLVQAVPKPITSTFDVGLTWPKIVDHRTSLLAAYPPLLQRYRAADDPLDLYGLPTSPVVDAGPMYVVRLQRAVLQQWKVKEPWAAVGDVTVANGGDVAKAAGVFPIDDLRPVAPIGSDWLANASAYTLSGTATWYGPGFVGKPMANGQIYHTTDATTTASNAYPLGSQLTVFAPVSKKTITVTVRDTGDFFYPDVVDLSPAAFASLGVLTTTGVVSVTVALAPPPAVPVTSKTQAPPLAKATRK